MNGRTWAMVMERALDRHDDAPTVEQVCAVTLEMFPTDWPPTMLPVLPLYAERELLWEMKRVTYLREVAREHGYPPGLSVMEIRARACKKLYRERHYPNVIGSNDVDAGTSCPLPRAAATL